MTQVVNQNFKDCLTETQEQRLRLASVPLYQPQRRLV
jgi:hypothetical protein